MTYPYNHNPKATHSTCMGIHEVAEAKLFTAALTDAGVSFDVNLPYNLWDCSLGFHTLANSAALSVKVRAWVDGAQTIRTTALSLSPFGATAATTVVTLASTGTSGTRGTIVSLMAGLVGGGATTYQKEKIPIIHGLQITVTAVTALTRGSYTLELLAVPEA